VAKNVAARVAVAMALLGLAGCARVKPQPDYARTAELIQQRVPVMQVFQPDEPPAPLPEIADGLTLEEALQAALLHNRELQTAFYDIGVARADLVQSQLLRNPVLSLAGMLPEGGGRADVQVGVGQEIADLWQIPIRKQIAQAVLDQTMLRVARQAVEVATMVQENYHRLQVLKESVRVAQENIEIARQSEQLTQARLRAGQAGKIDADLARADVLRAELVLIDLDRQRHVAQADLALAMGLMRWPGDDVQLEPLPPAQTRPIDVEAFVELALAERTDLQAARRAVEAARARISEQRLMIFPSLELGLSLERVEARSVGASGAEAGAGMAGQAPMGSTLDNLSRLGIQPRAPMPRESMIDAMLGPMISAPLPIFDQNQAQIARAVVLYRQAVTQYEQLARQVERDVRAAAANYTAATRTLVFYDEQLLPQLRQNLESATSAYRAGTSTVFVVIEAQRMLTMTNTDLYMARMTQLMAADQLEGAIGGRLVRQRAQAAVPADSGAGQ